MSVLIDTFVSNYSREFDFYQEAARLCAQACESLLKKNGIRGMVTFRAKRAERLRDKLTKREAERIAITNQPYLSTDEIRSDIVDLAGVRVALYFPADRDRFEKLVVGEFHVRQTKYFPVAGLERPDRRFNGYYATHHRVTLRASGDDGSQVRFLATPIEIQVASVLMHAWAEVEHDLVYKPLSGELSEDEIAIVDELNGLVLTGEIALERLQRAVEHRVAKADAAFSNRYELAAFLHDETRTLRTDDSVEPTMGDVGALLWLLQEAGRNRPDGVRPYLEVMQGGTEARPIADQVADLVLSERPELTEGFRARRTSPEVTSVTTEASATDALIGEFLSNWHVIQRFSRMLWKLRGSGIRPRLLMTHRDLARLLPSDRATIERLRWIWDFRNRVVHGRRDARSGELQEAISELKNIMQTLQQSSDEEARSVMQAAIAGEDLDLSPQSASAAK